MQWHPGITAGELQTAKIVRVPHGFRAADLANLRDDQMLETPSGTRMSVARVRKIENIVAEVKSRPRSPEPFHILPPPTKPCTETRPGESLNEVLARPDSDVVCIGKKHVAVSVAQLKLMKPFIQRMKGFDLSTAVVNRAQPSGPTTQIKDSKQLGTLIQSDAPDSTMLVNPKGERITLGTVRAAVKAKPELLKPPGPTNRGGRQ